MKYDVKELRIIRGIQSIPHFERALRLTNQEIARLQKEMTNASANNQYSIMFYLEKEKQTKRAYTMWLKRLTYLDILEPKGKQLLIDRFTYTLTPQEIADKYGIQRDELEAHIDRLIDKLRRVAVIV